MELVQRRMDESPLFSQWTYGQLPILINPPSTQCTASTGEKAAMTINFVDQHYMEFFELKLKKKDGFGIMKKTSSHNISLSLMKRPREYSALKI